ncbi:hypothetical protein SISNIDRAFT_215916 [Sistotremastrum niveocremeum HHB9708]|uniref:CSN8/PSMD8/EIF3K domain-containing protein n=2 Tax=Sistotremastraceae TaxID=3402574 RepID=A0A164QV04_9AGAM|nr:hypothetical protein SISNIDRAFT_215916 [Sistotremastrum niveocremeum HHB9708]KZT39223.1 hypothetical protein SISSUDRAFT_657348 [Sistotremastrum suecicum HHB10207 ss-3]
MEPKEPLTPPSTTEGPDVIIPQFQNLLPIFKDYLEKNQIAELVSSAEDSDLKLSSDGDTSRLIITSTLVLGYLILNEIPPARHAIQRLPRALSSHPLVKHLSSLQRAVEDMKYRSIYSRASDLAGDITGGALEDEQFGSLVNGLTIKFINEFRERTLDLLGKSYSLVPVALGEMYLGMPLDEFAPIAQGKGWTVNARETLSPPQSNVGREYGASSVGRLALIW